ncbi:MAG: rhomboid family intramembrane serine protease, partial [Moraxellaceae bacterium]
YALGTWYLFGTYAEFYYSRIWFVLIYVLGGIGGNLASNFVSVQDAGKFLQSPTADALQRYVPSVGAGASGAIMALGGALLIAALWPKADLVPKYRLNKNALVMLMLLNLGFGLFVEGINNAAHLGGFIAGVVLAVSYRISLTIPLSAKYAVQFLIAVAAIYVSYAINDWLMIQAQSMLPFWSKYLIIQ